MNRLELLSSYLPFEMWTWTGFLAGVGVSFFFIVARYFLFVGPFYVVFWHRKALRVNQLHDQKIQPNQIQFEIQWSLISSFVFAFFGWVLAVMWQQGWTLIYLPFNQYPLWYLPLSLLFASLIHEVYFYFTHIFMHRPKWFKRLHSYHHRSIKTSPWACFSFNPGEALIQAAFLPLLVLILPLHPVIILIYLVFMTLTAISNHLGYELIQNQQVRNWFISGTHHALHHQNPRGNYGLYFCFMDRLFKTEIKK